MTTRNEIERLISASSDPAEARRLYESTVNQPTIKARLEKLRELLVANGLLSKRYENKALHLRVNDAI